MMVRKTDRQTRRAGPTGSGMANHGNRTFSDGLSSDAYRDIATQRLAIHDIIYAEFKQLSQTLSELVR